MCVLSLKYVKNSANMQSCILMVLASRLQSQKLLREFHQCTNFNKCSQTCFGCINQAVSMTY